MLGYLHVLNSKARLLQNLISKEFDCTPQHNKRCFKSSKNLQWFKTVQSIDEMYDVHNDDVRGGEGGGLIGRWVVEECFLHSPD